MKNINVFSHSNVDIDSQEYNILTQDDMIKFLTDLLNACYYGGECVCLEKATIQATVSDGRIVKYVEIDRWD